MKIELLKLNLENFKNHETLNVEFGDITTIKGRNGAGKSSVADAITWCLFGTDALGSKLDPNPIGAGTEAKVTLLLEVADTKVILCRENKKTTKFYINEVPEKATVFNNLIESFFNKDLFLSLFNPNYFSSQIWQDQRAQLLSYIPEPLNKEVLATMSDVQVKYLADELKKRSLDDIEKLNKDRYKKEDKVLVQLQARIAVMTEQLEQPTVDVAEQDIISRIEALYAQQTALDGNLSNAHKIKLQRTRLETQIEAITERIQQQRAFVLAIKNEVTEENCVTCGQDLKEEHLKIVAENRNNRGKEAIATGKQLVADKKELELRLNMEPPFVDITDTRAEIEKIGNQLQTLRTQLNEVERFKKMQKELSNAKNEAEDARKQYLISQSTLDAVKTFKTNRSELMVTKVKESFKTISVKLFEQLKNGEERVTFEIEMNGKPYGKLSTAEKIKCGLELADVLTEKSGVIAPCFVDNAESVISFTKPIGQLITARVVDVDFNINTKFLDVEDVKNG